MKVAQTSTTRRTLFAGALIAPALAVVPALAATSSNEAAEVERQLDWWLAEELKFTAARGHTDEEIEAYLDRQAPVLQAAEALQGSSLDVLRVKAKAAFLGLGGDASLMVDEAYACNRMIAHILRALLGVA